MVKIFVRNAVIAAGLLILTTDPTQAGMMGQEECSDRCKDSYEQCIKTETEESVMKGFSCHEGREMCMLRCDNIADYLKCKTDGDKTLGECKDDFKDDVKDYRPILNN